MASTCSDLVPHAVKTPLQGARAHIPLCARGRLPQSKKSVGQKQKKGEKKVLSRESIAS